MDIEEMKELPFSKRKQTGNTVIDAQQFKEISENEASLQKQVEKYLTLHKIEYIRIPDSVYRLLFAKYKNKHTYDAARRLKGIPDLLIFRKISVMVDPIASELYCECLRMELKTKKGKLSTGQKKSKLPLVVCRSFEDAVKEIEEFMAW